MPKVLILGGTGFLGSAVASKLIMQPGTDVYLYSRRPSAKAEFLVPHVFHVAGDFMIEDNFEELVSGMDLIFHMVSPTDVSNTNVDVGSELAYPIRATCKLLDACLNGVDPRVVFVSSGGTVYGSGFPPFSEENDCKPVSAYGLQKLMTEQLFEFYGRTFGLDYRIARLSNPYGPGQNPEGNVGAVTKFVNKALKGEEIEIYGDGSVVRDFIYIDEAADGLINVAQSECGIRIFNIGSGVGTSVNELIETINEVLGCSLRVKRLPSRNADVPESWLDVERYSKIFAKPVSISLREGIKKTAEYLCRIEGAA